MQECAKLKINGQQLTLPLMLPPLKKTQPTSPTASPNNFDKTHIQHALFQARIGLREGGIPIGAALVR